mgnify:CR=1 FL=1
MEETMKTKNRLIVDQLPVKTWNRLNVNEAVIEWDEARTADLGTESHMAGSDEPVRIAARGEGEFSRKQVKVEAAPGTRITVYEQMEAEQHFHLHTTLVAHENAVIRLVQLQDTREGSLLYNQIDGHCEENGHIELIQMFVGRGHLYSDSRFTLQGDRSGLEADIGYLGRKDQKLDMNLAVDHFGKHTESEINAAGALMDSSAKVFRGTIDFKNGSSDSVGNEKETVLMLGENVINKTVPLILCAEENVVGNHGATIGELDDETLFYFESRGIGREAAEDRTAGPEDRRRGNGREDRSAFERGALTWHTISEKTFRCFSRTRSPIWTTRRRPSGPSALSTRKAAFTAIPTPTPCGACIPSAWKRRKFMKTPGSPFGIS